ncbi:MAG: hypothetical protein ACK42G_03235, partial [Candidatus Kapaibacteriota bacterium]
KLYGVGMEEALAYATVTHAINFLSQVIVGGLFLLRENLSLIPKVNPEEVMNNGKDTTSS